MRTIKKYIGENVCVMCEKDIDEGYFYDDDIYCSKKCVIENNEGLKDFDITKVEKVLIKEEE